jgi:hypothetical protein
MHDKALEEKKDEECIHFKIGFNEVQYVFYLPPPPFAAGGDGAGGDTRQIGIADDSKRAPSSPNTQS